MMFSPREASSIFYNDAAWKPLLTISTDDLGGLEPGVRELLLDRKSGAI
jgi:hypothetical protein